jgi:Bacterial extracellular solute-binding proteins, family 5 Middle
VLGNRIWLTGQQPYQDHAGGYGKGDTQTARRLLEQAGWTLGADGVYVKDGRRLELRCSTFTGDPRRRAEGELLQAQLADAGIQLRIVNTNIGVLFGDWIPHGNFDIADFAWIGVPYPISANHSIYTTGGLQNYGKSSDPKIDVLFQQGLGELDPERAAAIGNQIDQQLWTQLPSIPLYQLPSFLAWRQELLNVGDNPTVEGPFWNAGTWGVRQPIRPRMTPPMQVGGICSSGLPAAPTGCVPVMRSSTAVRAERATPAQKVGHRRHWSDVVGVGSEDSERTPHPYRDVSKSARTRRRMITVCAGEGRFGGLEDLNLCHVEGRFSGHA